jgi:hypothetical protein
MSATMDLEHSQLHYVDGPTATALHTVDVWLPRTPRDAHGDKLWLM